MSVKKVAQSLIKKFQVDEGVLNMIEMASRAYDPSVWPALYPYAGWSDALRGEYL